MVVIPEHFICSLVFQCNFAVFAVKRISLSPWRILPGFWKVWSSFRNFFSIMVFAAETSRKCISVTYNFCSFRPKRAFPRPWAARWINDKYFVISFCSFVFMFCCFQKVCRRAKSDRNPILVVFFAEIYLSRKVFCKTYPKSILSTVCNLPQDYWELHFE